MKVVISPLASSGGRPPKPSYFDGVATVKMFYCTVEAQHDYTLHSLVDKKLAEGWKLSGGVCVTMCSVPSSDRTSNVIHRLYAQALTKEEVLS